MALDRIYRIGDTPVWAGVRSDSPLATVGETLVLDDGSTVTALSTQTIRMRWRSDIEVNTVIRDSDNRRWFVNEILEIGRRQWLDVGISTYDSATVTATGQIPQQDSNFVAPTGWGLTVRSQAAPYHNLQIATVQASGDRRRRGTFAIPADLAGSISATDAIWYFRIRAGSADNRYIGGFELNDRTSPVDLAQGFNSLSFYIGLGNSPITGLNEGHPEDELNLALNNLTSLATGDVLELLSRSEVATLLNQ